jgi:TatD DNase family protein
MKKEDIIYFDCHSHPHDVKYKREGVSVDAILEELKKDGGATIAVGTDYELSKEALEVAKKHENVWCTMGVHPADNGNEVFDERFAKLYEENKDKIVGVGECGLDYFYFDKVYESFKEGGEKGEAFFAAVNKEKDRQKKLFEQQIEFALKNNLPLVLHGRPTKNSMDAYRDMLDTLEQRIQESKVSSQLTGHAHFFVGNLEIAKRFLNLGFLMSFDGPITFTNEYDEVIKFLPIEKIMIETDSPYAAPTPYRGQTCYPKYVVEVAKKISALKDIPLEEVLEVTKNNTFNLFKIN